MGGRARLAPIWRHYGVRPQGDGFDHTASVVLLDGTGRQRIGFPVERLTPEGLAHDIRALRAGLARRGPLISYLRGRYSR